MGSLPNYGYEGQSISSITSLFSRTTGPQRASSRKFPAQPKALSNRINSMSLKLTRHFFYPLHARYLRPVRWAGHVEAGVDVLLLVIETDQGLKGVGETPVRLNWHAHTLKSLMVVLEQVFLPRMKTLDLADADAVKAFLGTFKEHPLAKSLIDTACWDLRARLAGVPLWKALGATDPNVPISWTITRADPQDMAREAGMISERYGIQAFKVKTGQGIETDRIALKNIRRVVGDKVALYADSNGAHHAAEVRDMSKLLAEYGVILFEDPCAFAPNDAFRAIVESSQVPILVDNRCRSVSEAMLLLDVGAKALSVKVMKTGITESRVIADLARAKQARVAVGISAATSLGAMNALALSASLPTEARCAPCEETFFATMEEILVDPLTIKDGSIKLPEISGYEALVDWTKVSNLCAAPRHA
jgi:L-alanine-DL-glutamate epimerase-like enolase superfamily enzyme